VDREPSHFKSKQTWLRSAGRLDHPGYGAAGVAEHQPPAAHALGEPDERVDPARVDEAELGELEDDGVGSLHRLGGRVHERLDLGHVELAGEVIDALDVPNAEPTHLPPSPGRCG
jgi:hypothetical protein